MKIVFTAKGSSWSSPIDERFGRAELFVVYNEDSNNLEVISNDEVKNMGHGAGLQISKKILDLKPDVVITGNGAGEKALKILSKSNLKMYIGAGNLSLKEAYEAFKNGKLELQF